MDQNDKKSATGRAPSRRFAPLLGALALTILGGCASDSNPDSPQAVPFAELFEQGITRYLGLYSPMLSEADGEVITHTFGTGDGPMCLDGSEYRMATRDAASENLVIFLQGGGACWSELCRATTDAAAGMPLVGILDPQRENNPVKDWNQVFLPYCDGGLHASDRDNDYDGDGIIDAPQRGLHNLSAALDVAARNFPNPKRILLTGSSGGGFGTIFALPLVSYLYPGVPIDIVNDSGVGVSKPGKPEHLMLLQNDWNQTAFLPDSCPECLDPDGHLTNYLIWQLDQDPSIRAGYLSYTQDFVIGDIFLGIGGPAFEAALFEEMAQQEAAHPDRFRSWIPAGTSHTFLMAEPDQTAGGVPVMDWITAMLNDSPDWVSVAD